jgi:uncharacterized repeat protein (TIGR01451 family)
VSAAAASQLVVTTQPSATATGGVTFATQPVVKEEDAFGNVITTDNTHTVTVARGNHGTASLQGSPLTVTLINGVATFSGLSYNVAETMNLSFSTNAGAFTTTSNDVVVSAAAANLTVTKTDSGNFFRGEIGATFTITVTNNGTAPTSGTINLADGLPGGLTATDFVGTGWTVDLVHFTATFSGPLNADQNSTLTLTVNVDDNALSSLTNLVTVSGGGVGSPAATSDPLAITPNPLTIADSGQFFRGEVGAKFSMTVTNFRATPTTGTTTVVDGLPGGLTATALSGTGWTIDLAHFTATRTNALAPGASFPPLIFTVNVDTNAPNSLTNFASLTGVGVTNADTVNDPVAIGGPSESGTSSHTGNFFPGEIGATYSITLTNPGSTPTSGTINLADELPGAFTVTSFVGTGWTTNLTNFTATRSDALAPGQSYPTLTITVNVSKHPPQMVNNFIDVTLNGNLVRTGDPTQI